MARMALIRWLALIVVLAVTLGSVPASARADGDGHDRVLVRFAASASAPERADAERRVAARATRALPALERVEVLRVDRGEAAAAARSLRRPARCCGRNPINGCRPARCCRTE